MIDKERIKEAFSSTHWLFTRFARQPDEPSVISLLTKELPHIDASSWVKRLNFGGVFINGIGFYEDTVLPEICKVEYYEPRFDIADADRQYPAFSTDWVVWEDADLIITYKPTHLPSLPGKEQRNYNLKNYLESHLGKTLHFPSRLDMSTQGLVIASKSERMHGPIQALFEKRKIQKEYLFQTTGHPKFKSIKVDAPIGKCAEHPVLRAANGVNAKKSVTEFSVVMQLPLSEADAASPLTTFIHARPLTGRTHQIRVHAAHLDIPIIGDNFYGGFRASPLRLLSFALRFEHPFTEERLSIVVPSHLAPAWSLVALKSLGTL